MANPPSQYPGVFRNNVSTKNYEDPLNLGLRAIIDPTRHGKQVTPDNLPRVNSVVPSAWQFQCQTFNPPDPGTAGIHISETGEPSTRTVLGIYNEKYSAQSSMPGNNPLSYWPNLLSNETLDKVLGTGFQSAGRDVEAFVAKNKSQMWKHADLKGMATHGADTAIAGPIVNAVKNVETAIEQFAATLSGSGALSALSQMGSMMNMKDMLSNLSTSQKQRLEANLDSEMIVSFNSMLNMMSDDVESTEYAKSGRVNTEVFVENAITLVSQASSYADLSDILLRLKYDTSLHGNVGSIKIATATPFGVLNLAVDGDGNLDFDDDDNPSPNVNMSVFTSLYDPTSNLNAEIANSAPQSSSGGGNKQTLQNISQIANMVMNAASNAGIDNTLNLFGDQASKIHEMVGRLHPSAGQELYKVWGQVMSTASTLGPLRNISRTKNMIGSHGLNSLPAIPSQLTNIIQQAQQLVGNLSQGGGGGSSQSTANNNSMIG